MRRLLRAAIAIPLISVLTEVTALAGEDRRSPPHSPAPTFVSALRRSVDFQLDPTPFFLKGFAPELGSVEPGKRAELLAVRVPRTVPDVEEYLVRGIEPADILWLDW